MAIGVDNRLKPPASTSASPLSSPGQAKQYMRAPQIADSAIADQANNLLAASSGGSRTAMQNMDRAGVSRGRGHQYRGDYAQAQADVQGRLAAAQATQGATAANAQARQEYRSQLEASKLNTAGLLESLRTSKNAQGLARRSMQQNLLEAHRQGQLGLDSIQLDTSPLLERLLTN